MADFVEYMPVTLIRGNVIMWKLSDRDGNIILNSIVIIYEF